MNKKLPVIFVLLITPFLLTACTIKDVPLIGGLFGAASKAPVSLSAWGVWENPEVIKSVVDKYSIDHPNVTVNYNDFTLLKPADYKERVISKIQSDQEKQDIVLVHNSWVKTISPALSPVPDSVFNADTYKKTFYNVASESATVDGKIYAVPAYYDGLVLVYNKDHFKEINQLEAPSSWEEFRQLAVRLTVRGTDDKIVRAGAAMGTANNIDFATDIYGLLLAQVDATVPDDLDSRAAQDALLFYTNFAKPDKDNVWNGSFPEASYAFAEGRVSMILVPTWNLLDIIAAKPNLNIGVAPVPQANKTSPVSWGSFWMYAVPANSSNKEAAWEFIKFMVQPDQQKMMFDSASRYRQYGSPYANVVMGDQLKSNPYLKPLIETATYAKSGIFAARAGNQTAEKALRTAISSVLESQNESPAALLKIAKTAILPK